MSIYDEFAQSLARPPSRGTEPVDGSYISAHADIKKQKRKDLLLAVPRGIEGAVKGTYNLVDFVLADSLPDYEHRLLGRSETMGGSLVEGATQFLTGFIPFVGWLGKAGRAKTIANHLKLTKKTGKGRELDLDLAHKILRKKHKITAEEAIRIKRLDKTLRKKQKGNRGLNVVRGAQAGAMTDFIAFEAQEQRLANLINMHPKLKNPVSEYLAADEDDGELEGRFKNVVEGLFLEAGIQGIAQTFIGGVKLIKRKQLNKRKGMTEEEAIDDAIENSPITEDQINPTQLELGVGGYESRAGGPSRPLGQGQYQPELDFSTPPELKQGELDLDAPVQLEFELGTGGKPKDPQLELDFEGKPPEIDLQPRNIVKPTPRLDTKTMGTLNMPALRTEARRLGIKITRTSTKKSLIASIKRAYKKEDKAGGVFNAAERRKFEDKRLADELDKIIDDEITRNTRSILKGVEQQRAKNIIGKKGDKTVDELDDVIGSEINRQAEGVDNLKQPKGKVKGPDPEQRDFLDEMEQDQTPKNTKAKNQEKRDTEKDIENQKTDNLPPDPPKPSSPREEVLTPPRITNNPEEDFKSFTRYVTTLLNRGGKQGIESAVRAVRNSKELVTLSRAIAKLNIEKFGVDRTSKDELINPEFVKVQLSQIQGANRAIGGNVTAAMKRVDEIIKTEGQDVKEALAELLYDQKALYEVQETLARQLRDSVLEYKNLTGQAGKRGDEATAEAVMFDALDKYIEAQRMFAMYGRAGSLSMLQRKFLYGAKKGDISPTPNRSFGFDVSLVDDRVASKNFVDSIRGTMPKKKLIALLEAATTATNAKQMDEVINSVNHMTKARFGKKIFDMSREWWINGLLSGPTTQIVNIIGNSMTMMIREMESLFGAIATMDKDYMRAFFDFEYTKQSFVEAMQIAIRTLKTQEAITISNRRVFDDRTYSKNQISAQGAGVGDDTAFGNALNWLGKTVNLPSTFLLTGDEFFKAMNYRKYIRVELATDGAKRLGLRDRELAEYVENGLQSHVTQEGRMFNEANLYRDARAKAEDEGLTFEARARRIEELMEEGRQRALEFDADKDVALAERARQWTLINTHTQDVAAGDNWAIGVNELLQAVTNQPILSFIVPFIRTPSNILKFGTQRTVVGGLVDGFKLVHHNRTIKKLTNQLDRGTAREKQELIGRLAFTTMTSLIIVDLIRNNKEKITGFGPSRDASPLEREAWKKSGKMEYAIFSETTGKWHSYQRLDPIATVLGIYVDMIDAHERGDIDVGDMERIGAVTMAAIVNNVTSKSYLQGLDNFINVFKDVEKNAIPFAGQINAGFMPNFFSQTMNVEEERTIYEARKFTDFIVKRTPDYMDNIGLKTAKTLTPKRGPLGDVETFKPASGGGILGMLNPIYERTPSEDPIDIELYNIGGIGAPTERLGGQKSLNMKEYYNDEGRQAYDRYQELVDTMKIQGLTLRQTLAKLMQSDTYKLLPMEPSGKFNIKSARHTAIMRIVNRFRERAKADMLKEFPELSRNYLEYMSSRRTRIMNQQPQGQ